MGFDVAGYLRSLSRFGLKPGLERIEALLRRLGQPQRSFPAVHIAGTNGKGSVTAMTASMLAAAGYRVGMYTSPHLVRYEERIRVNGQEIPYQDLSRIMARVAQAATDVSGEQGGDPTEFEIGTAAAFVYFQEQHVDVAVVEVGLGGRLDSTNVLDPVAVALTPISLDHVTVLGHDLRSVAREKAGILKPRRPAVIAPQSAEAEQEIKEAARRIGVPLLWLNEDAGEGAPPPAGDHQGGSSGAGEHATDAVASFRTAAWNLSGGTFSFRKGDAILPKLHTPLLGRHQIINAATAVGLTLTLRDQAFDIPDSAIVRGLSAARWPGRLAVIPGTPPLLLDGVHNEDGAHALAQAIEHLFPKKRIVFVAAVMSEKSADAILDAVLPHGSAVVFTAPRSSRIPPMEPEVLVELATEKGFDARSVPGVEHALAVAGDLSGPEGMVCVCGSLYLVGEVLDVLDKEKHSAVP